MFDMLDVELPRQGCDHSRRLTQAWLAARGYEAANVFAWLDEHGGYCDCEVLANVEQVVDEARRVMDIEIYPPMTPSRPCRFCLCLQGGSVFADFDVDADGRVFAVRVSFDGYGCCHAPENVGRMNERDSAAMLTMVEAESIDSEAEAILRRYFHENRDAFWSDALADHGLL